MTDHTPLISRLEEATDGSEELDAHIMCALVLPAGSYVERSKLNGAWCLYEASGRLWERRGWWREGGWHPTTSLDAALALVERKLPGVQVSLWIYASMTSALIGAPGREKPVRARTSPLALCIALLHALQQDKTP